MFTHIGTAIAFSPRFEALIAESLRLSRMFDARLSLIHVGEKTEEKIQKIDAALDKLKANKERINVIWNKGDTAKCILNCCGNADIDLIIAGAMKKENIFRYYIGSVARRILRKASCSVLVLTDPSKYPKPFKRIMINGDDSPVLKRTLETGFEIAQMENAVQLHLLRDLTLYGLNMVVAGEEFAEDQYGDARKRLVQDEIDALQKIVDQVEGSKGLRINIKITSGKGGYEMVKFSDKFSVDLIVYGAQARPLKFIDRIIPHDLEYILADLPANLLVYHPEK